MAPLPAGSAEQQTLEIVSKSGVHVFTVELAVTDEERQTGLMFRRSLPESTACCSTSSADQDVSMWMRNTYVSLDMIFIRADGRIQRIAENTETESDRIIPRGARCAPCSKWWPAPRRSSASRPATGWRRRFSANDRAAWRCFAAWPIAGTGRSVYRRAAGVSRPANGPHEVPRRRGLPGNFMWNM